MPSAQDTSRLLARLALGTAFAIAVIIPVVAFIVRGADKPETWTVAAAALAVITSVISTWSSRRILELQEDAQKPNPTPAFDLSSRHGLALLRVKNTGAATAHNVSLEWDIELFDHHKKKIEEVTVAHPQWKSMRACEVVRISLWNWRNIGKSRHSDLNP